MPVLGYDTLLNLTNSRYRLSVIAAKRSVQLKKGFPTTLTREEYPQNRDGVSHNVVAVALQELLLDKNIVWGERLPSDVELLKAFELTKRAETLHYSVTLKQAELDDDMDESSPTNKAKARIERERQGPGTNFWNVVQMFVIIRSFSRTPSLRVTENSFLATCYIRY
jgi:DNA-directed RNA polymerase subunit omega